MTLPINDFVSTQSTLIIDRYWRHTCSQASKNILWCLLGCCIGDFDTIGYFHFTEVDWPVSLIIALAIVNGIFTSIILETIILTEQILFKLALKTAIGMSLVSMISMKAVMNLKACH